MQTLPGCIPVSLWRRTISATTGGRCGSSVASPPPTPKPADSARPRGRRYGLYASRRTWRALDGIDGGRVRADDSPLKYPFDFLHQIVDVAAGLLLLGPVAFGSLVGTVGQSRRPVSDLRFRSTRMASRTLDRAGRRTVFAIVAVGEAQVGLSTTRPRLCRSQPPNGAACDQRRATRRLADRIRPCWPWCRAGQGNVAAVERDDGLAAGAMAAVLRDEGKLRHGAGLRFRNAKTVITVLLRETGRTADRRQVRNSFCGTFVDSGQGRDRTADTRIFSPLLYQLSYLSETWKYSGASSL